MELRPSRSWIKSSFEIIRAECVYFLPASIPPIALRPGECKGGFLTAGGGFNRSTSGVPSPSQPQNALFAFLAAASYDW